MKITFWNRQLFFGEVIFNTVLKKKKKIQRWTYHTFEIQLLLKCSHVEDDASIALSFVRRLKYNNIHLEVNEIMKNLQFFIDKSNNGKREVGGSEKGYFSNKKILMEREVHLLIRH